MNDRAATEATVATHRPSLVSWNLTRACNLRCPHCYLSAGKKGTDELSTDACFVVLDAMQRLGTEMVILTGGEPLLRKDIYRLAERAAERGMWVVMGTNGVLINDRVARSMVDCGVRGVAISLDSIDPEKHDRFRGGPDAWKHSVKALDVCKSNGLEVLVQTTVMDWNRDEIPALIDFTRARGAWSFNLYFLVQTGRGQRMNDLDAEATESLLGELVDAQDTYKPMLVRSKCAPHFKRIAYERGQPGLESGGCMAGTEYCRITPEGDVTPCPYMDVVAGNVRGPGGFEAVWREAPVFADLRDLGRLGGRCGACEHKSLCGGCRCRAQAAFGDYLQEDPACSYQPGSASVVPMAEPGEVVWSPEARARLERIPIRFVRLKVEKGLVAYAQSHGKTVIDAEVMKDGMQGFGRSFGGGMPPFVRRG